MINGIQITKINVKIESDGLQEIVNKVYFNYTDNKEYIGIVAPPNADSFTAYEDLTESQVVDWINVSEAIDNKCADNLSPICVLKDPPW